MNNFYLYQIASSLWARSGNNKNAIVQQIKSLKAQKEEIDKVRKNKKNKKEVPKDREYYDKLVKVIAANEEQLVEEQHILDCVTPFKKKIEKKYFKI